MLKKLKDWVALCISELEKLGYRQIELVGKGAYGFVFAGLDQKQQDVVFKFSRINLPPHIQERLADEGYMLSQAAHPNVPPFFTYQLVKKQGILMMGRAKGVDLEHYSLKQGRLPVRLLLDIATQLASLLLALRQHKKDGESAPIVHGDIKPSNIVYDESTNQISLVDWGSSVFAQLDSEGHYIGNNVMQLMSADLQTSNARLGDVYFIGPEQRSVLYPAHVLMNKAWPVLCMHWRLASPVVLVAKRSQHAVWACQWNLPLCSTACWRMTCCYANKPVIISSKLCRDYNIW